MSRTRRHVIVAVFFLAGGCLAGGLLGGRAQADADRGSASLRNFGRVLALVEDNYVGKVDSEELVESAIQGMLRTLDPHSNYLDKAAFTEMRDEQRGRFYGLGIQITKRGPDRPLTIIAPIDGTPAARAGLQPGDVIFKIEGQETINLTVQEAVRRLKGEKGSKVTITIQRPGDGSVFDVSLVRDEIPTHSIGAAFMVKPDVGLIRISNFTSTTATELDEAIHRLTQAGMKNMILDLRANPGGLLDQAVGVSERFIPSGKMIVYTRGRVAGADQDYLASKGVERVTVPLVVLVNHASASASEIVSGAIQDHDRGLVVGETTFGKGLVQRVIPLRDGGAVALTTAKYYTPSGRLIQRDYSNMDDYFDPDFDDEAGPREAKADAEAEAAHREVKFTDAGRKVFGGGGITPDYIVPTERFSMLLTRLVRDNMLFDYAVRYVAAHPDVQRDFAVDDKMLGDLKEFLRGRSFAFAEDAFAESKTAIAIRLKSQIARVKWGVDAEGLALAEGDVQLQKALTLFDEASKLAKAGERGRLEKDQAGLLKTPKRS